MVCTCGNFGCAVRIGRGLAPFCCIAAKPSAPKPGYPTYAAAVAANPGKRIIALHTPGQGQPKRFDAR